MKTKLDYSLLRDLKATSLCQGGQCINCYGSETDPINDTSEICHTLPEYSRYVHRLGLTPSGSRSTLAPFPTRHKLISVGGRVETAAARVAKLSKIKPHGVTDHAHTHFSVQPSLALLFALFF
ncbi:hypothetical protein L1887_33903 [Cichorium endivia]|nr:hypothetical protein L1887_33903 [Cichorium endivia]